MKSFIYKAINKFGYNIYSKRNREFEIEKDLEKFQVKIHKRLLLYSYKYVNLLANKFPDLRIVDSEDGLKVSFSEFTFYIESQEEFLILIEIFIDEEYKFLINDNCVLIDIGANIGIASIYFSQFKNVHKIYAYEPVKDTYEIANKNFQENNIVKHIELHNFGLGAKDSCAEFLYSKDAKGNSGMRGKLSPSHNNRKNSEIRKVEIKDIKKILIPIIENNKEFKIVLKMDCEGAEYEIMDSLDNHNLLADIDIIILEWHDFEPGPIESILIENNFAVFSRNLDSISGIISAIKN